MSALTRRARKLQSGKKRSAFQFEALEERLVMSGQSLANAFGVYEDQIAAAGDLRTVKFAIAESALSAEPTFVNLSLVPQLAATSRLVGDYDIDGQVDAADHLAWKQNFGAIGLNPADGNGDGIVDTADFTLWRDNLGAIAVPQSVLQPASVVLRNGHGSIVTPTQAGTPGTSSFALYALSAGEYVAELAANGSGAFRLDISLTGDVDGDRIVEESDLTTIRSLITSSGFDASADVNFDGKITSFDYSYARRNLNRQVDLTAIPAVTLGETNSFVRRLTQTIDMTAVEGVRTLTFDVEAAFDPVIAHSGQQDLFQVYLNDRATGTSLFGEGAIFSLSAIGAEYAPGLVTFDGRRIAVDLSSISGIPEAELVFQLLSGDSITGTEVYVSGISNSVEAEGVPQPMLIRTDDVVDSGPPLDLSTLHNTTDISPILTEVQFDPAEGIYRAKLNIRNNGGATGRNVAVLFDALPPAVVAINPTGVDLAGRPYWNLQNAIPSGGLKSGAQSASVEIAFKNPLLERIAFAPTVLVGAPNQSPALDDLPSLQATPGEKLTLEFPSVDIDGDRVNYTLSAPAGLPRSQFLTSGQLEITPGIDELGTYQFSITASDGAISVTRDYSLEVVRDAVTTTRISGIVLDTHGLPLDNVPVEIAGFSTRTGPDGSFTITLPTMKTPTEAFNIAVPAGDVFLDPLNTGAQEITLRRARFDVTSGDSPLNPRQHSNLVSSFLDAGVVYGSDPVRAAGLRTFNDGKLKTSAGNLLPVNNAATFPDGLFENDNEGRVDPTTLFVSGDVRTNENVALIALHTVFVREHNRLADEIKTANPTLTDEAIYQQARRIVGAIFQQITYNEYLPLLLGANALAPYSGYNSTVDPRESELFAAAAFRLGHTQLSPEIARLDAAGQSLPGGPLALRHAFFTPQPIVNDGIEPFLRGLAATPMQEMDTKIIDDVRNFLFGPPGSGGMDLASINIQRGRDVGLPSYTQARLDFGLPEITSFAQITSNVSLRTALENIYGSVDKVDVWVGGLAEDRVPGALVGPLFQAILKDQFQRTRDGDRFWYENGQFTAAELATIRGTTLEQLIERNAPGVDLPAHPFSTGTAPTSPAPAGTVATTSVDEFRSFDGSGNNLAQPSLGATGGNVVRNFSNGYGDGISTPGGSDRPGPREISNAVNAQSGSVPSATGLSSLLTFWGQLLDHDLGLTPGGVSDTLKIQGNLRPIGDDGAAYPFVAEKMGLMLDHPVYPGVNNVIVRPIYLPALDVDNSVTIDPEVETLVTTDAIPGASVLVEKQNLKDRQGQLFTQELSITEVPRDLTPAALPPGMFPDLVVTIQPADMVFSTPAPLSLPNRAGYAPGTVMDLWSINPITGFFDNVGTGKVSLDGSVINTTAGGIRNSSWHFFAPPPPTPDEPSENPRNPDEGCQECAATQPLTSDVELHSGAVIETHSLVPYQSLGVSRGVTLTYDSLRADPRPIVHFSYSNVPEGSDQRLVAELLIGKKGVGSGGGSGSVDRSFEGEITYSPRHYWSVPESNPGGKLDAAIQADLRGMSTGVYYYQIRSGIMRYTGGELFGSMAPSREGDTIVVNSIDSVFGAGWGIAGLQHIVEIGDRSLLLIDGDGSELRFRVRTDNIDGSIDFNAPAGDFSTFKKLADGTYTRTTTDKTVYRFDAQGRITTMTDRNGNATRYEYGASGIERIIDPVGLTTTFAFTGSKVTSIIDPAGRVTQLLHDADGNLQRIVDPDLSDRTFGYDDANHLASETDQLGRTEQTLYDFAGRATGAIRKDGTVLAVSPVQTQGLFAPDATASPAMPPQARHLGAAEASYSDSNGKVIKSVLDRAGQQQSGADGGGATQTIARNVSNLVTTATDSRGFATSYTYDSRGYVTSIEDEVIRNGGAAAGLYPNERVDVGGDGEVVTGDFNGDGVVDVVVGSRFASGTGTSNGLSLLLGSGDGTFQPRRQLTVGEAPLSAAAGDFNEDGFLDIVTGNRRTDNVSILLGVGDGTFGPQQRLTVGDSPVDVIIADINGDAFLDVLTANVDSDDVSILLGNGNGTFQTQQRISTGDGASSLESSDFNRDGILDIVVANAHSDDVSVHLGRGDGTFQSQVRFAAGDGEHIVTGGTFYSSVAVGDFDKDGVSDFAVANPGSDDVSILLGRGDGSFALQTRFPVGDAPSRIAARDVTNDGTIDLIVGNIFSQDVSVLPGLGNGAFATQVKYDAGGAVTSVAIEDFDGNGTVDLGAIDSTWHLTIRPGLATGGFEVETRVVVNADRQQGTQPGEVASGDFNRDGIVDLAVISFAHLSIVLGKANGDFEPPRFVSAGVNPNSLTLADFNGDGILDVACANHGQNRLTVLNGVGDGTFEAARSITLARPQRLPSSIASGDVTGDGISDLIFADVIVFPDSSSISALFALPGLGNGNFAAEVAIGEATDFEVVDVNGDGVSDVVGVYTEEGMSDPFPTPPTGHVFITYGGPSLGVRTTLSTTALLSFVVVGDFNNDGNLDIVTSGYPAPGDISEGAIFFGRSDGSFGPEIRIEDMDAVTVSGDVNGDGFEDLLATRGELQFGGSSSLGGLSVRLGLGDGTFLPARQYALGKSPGSPILLDVNRDGLDDVVTPNADSFDLSILLSSVQLVEKSKPLQLSYDASFSQLTSITDERGHETLYTIDPINGNRLTMREVVGQVDGTGNTETDDLVTQYTYNPRGQMRTTTDPLGRVTEFGYDAAGRLTLVTFAKGTADEAVERYEYDQATTAGRAGLVTAYVDGEGRRTEYEYDVMNRLVRTTAPDPDGAAGPLGSPVTRFSYDARGNLDVATDALGNATDYDYDPLDRVIRTTSADPDGTTGPLPSPVTQFTYDKAGNLALVIDPLGHETRHRYDARNRRIETVDTDGGVTKFRYDADNNLTSLTDSVGNRTTFGYDARGRLIRETDSLGGSIIYFYDGADNLVRKTDRIGRATNYSYDDLDRLTSETWVGANHAISYAYDKAGNLLTVSDPLSSLAFTYDARDRVKTVDNRGGLAQQGTPGAPRVVLTYAYDDVGNVLSVVDTISGVAGATTAYQYDGLNRVKHITQAGAGLANKRVDLAYNPLGQYESVRRYADLAGTQLVVGTSYTYDALNRLDVMRHTNGTGQTVAYYDLDFDAASRIARITDIDGAADYTYDDRDQLTGAYYDAARETAGYADETYQYDANGNRLTSHLHGAGYVTGPGNRLLSDGTYNYEYDAEGNTTKRTEIATGAYREFAWDHRNRLISVADKLAEGTATQVVEFTYDALDRRIAKAVDTTPADAIDSANLHFVYDREDVILDFRDPDGSGAAPAAFDQRYLHGAAIDEVFAQDDGTGTVHWHLTDHLGTIRDLADAAGGIANHIRYDSYGNIESNSGNAATRYSFTGRERDSEVDLYYYRARYYDAVSGRFVSEDPIMYLSGEVNRWRYVSNGPVDSTDPSGLMPWWYQLLEGADFFREVYGAYSDDLSTLPTSVVAAQLAYLNMRMANTAEEIRKTEAGIEGLKSFCDSMLTQKNGAMYDQGKDLIRENEQRLKDYRLLLSDIEDAIREILARRPDVTVSTPQFS